MATLVVLGAAGSSAISGCRSPDSFQRPLFEGPALLTCHVTRKECAEIQTADHGCVRVDEVQQAPFDADFCFELSSDSRKADDICFEKMCTKNHDSPDPATCMVSGQITAIAAPGLCKAAEGTQFATYTWHTHQEVCGGSFIPGTCELAAENLPHTECGSLGPVPLEISKALPTSAISPAIHFDSITPVGFCTHAAQRFQFASQTVGTGSAAGTTATISARRGTAGVNQTCDVDGCLPSQLASFDLDLADMTVAGASLTNLSLHLTSAAPVTQIVDTNGGIYMGIAAGALGIQALGKYSGVNAVYTATNVAPWRLDVTNTTFRVRGSLALNDVASNGGVLPVTITADASGTPATAQTIACQDASSLSRLFGFEDPSAWTSAQAAVSLVTSPITQGCSAVGVRGQGYFPIDSVPFSTRGLTTNAATTVDLFIPSAQPNPYWTGLLQQYLSCPSGAFYHQFIGQVELTGKAQNKYTAMRIPLTTAARNVLARQLDDCSFEYALNVNNTSQTWIFDNLRFTP